MHRIDTTTKFTDLFGPGKHGFRDGDKAIPVSATQFNAAWANSIQEELANAIEAEGIVLNPASNTQLATVLSAKARLSSPTFTGTPTTPTPAQFDASQKIANTEFIRRAIGNCSGYYYLDAATSLLASHLGGFIDLAGNLPGQVYTLPSVSVVPAGWGYWLCNISGQPVTIKGTSVPVEYIYSARGAGNTFTLNVGESCYIACNAGGNWNVRGLTLAPGVGQTYRDYTASRALNTTYSNTSYSPRTVVMAITNSIQAHATMTVTNPFTNESCVIVGSGSYQTYDQACCVSVTVPPFHTYRGGSNVGIPVLLHWSEMS